MAETLRRSEPKPSSFVEGIRDIQAQYMMLADLQEKEKTYTARLTDVVKTIQREADEVIPLRPELIGDKCQAAYLVSDAVVVMFDVHRHMSSKPLGAFPADVMVSVIEDSANALRQMIAERRRARGERVESLEKVLKEVKKAQATLREARAGEPLTEGLETVNSADPSTRTPPMGDQVEGVAPRPQQEADEETAALPQKDPFTFKGSYGEKVALELLTD